MSNKKIIRLQVDYTNYLKTLFKFTLFVKYLVVLMQLYLTHLAKETLLSILKWI